MAYQLLWLQALICCVAGAPLLLFPNTSIRLLGLPRSEHPFWPRLAGAFLVGMAIALGTQGKIKGMTGITSGLGLAGIVVIDLAVAALLTVLLILQKTGAARRGRWLLLAFTILLVCLSFLAIPFTG